MVQNVFVRILLGATVGNYQFLEIYARQKRFSLNGKFKKKSTSSSEISFL
jgi:hypothetical protein